MKFIEFDIYKIPLTHVTGLSYSLQANTKQVRNNTLKCVGISCPGIALAFRVDRLLAEYLGHPYDDIIEHFLELSPQREKTFPVRLDGLAINGSTTFSIESCTTTIQADATGVIDELQVSINLVPTAVVKSEFNNSPVSYEAAQIPVPKIVCDGKEFSFGEGVSITEYKRSPTTLDLSVKLGWSGAELNSTAWILKPTHGGYIEIEDTKYYIIESSFDGDFITYKGSIFTPESEEVINRTFIGLTLKDVLRGLKIPCSVGGSSRSITSKGPSIGNIDVSYFRASGSSLEILERLSRAFGFLTGFRGNQAVLFDPPKTLEPTFELNYFIEMDEVNTPVTGIVWRDNEHEYKRSTGEKGSEIVVNSPVRSTTDRCDELIDAHNLKGSGIDLYIPLDVRIRHWSIVGLNYNGGTLPCVVMDYVADYLSNQMQLKLGYIRR